jgi:Cu-processing system permease protein
MHAGLLSSMQLESQFQASGNPQPDSIRPDNALAIGYFVSTLVRDRGAAGGAAIGVWFFFVLLYDMALLGALVADQGRTVTAEVLNALLLLNPADAYRLLNLSASSDVSRFAGVAGLGASAGLSPHALIGALVAWTIAPLAAATALFGLKQL